MRFWSLTPETEKWCWCLPNNTNIYSGTCDLIIYENGTAMNSIISAVADYNFTDNFVKMKLGGRAFWEVCYNHRSKLAPDMTGGDNPISE